MTYTATETSFWADDFLTEADQQWFETTEAELWALAQDAADVAESNRQNDWAEYAAAIAEAADYAAPEAETPDWAAAARVRAEYRWEELWS